MAILKEILSFIKSDYLLLWWILVIGYILCYLLAWVLATAGHGGNIVFRCRQAWAWAFSVHGLAVVGTTLYWWQKFGMFKSFFVFIGFYTLLLLIDLILAAKLFSASRS